MFKSHAFKTFFLSYLIFIAITLTTFIITYRLIYNVIDRNNEELSSHMLTHASDTAEPYTEAISNIISQISNNSDMTAFLTKEICNPSSPDYNPGQFSKLISQLKSISGNGPFNDVYLYSHVNNKIITTVSTFSPQDMYGTFLRFGDKDFNEFYSEHLNIKSYNRLYPEMKIMLSGEESDYILSMTSLPALDENISGNLMLFIDSQKLLKSIGSSFDSSGTCSYFYYKDTLLAKSKNAPALSKIPMETKTSDSLDGEEYLLYTSKNSGGYSFVIAIPKKIALRSLTGFKWLMLLSILCSTIVYAFAAVILSHYNVRPIKNIVSRFGGTSSSAPNEYAVISDSISALITEKDNLQTERAQNLPILISNYLHMLLNGHLTDTTVINETAKKLGLDIPWKDYYLLILSPTDSLSSELSDIEKLINAGKEINSHLSPVLRYISCDISAYATAYLIDCGEDKENTLLMIEEAVNEASDAVFDSFSAQVKAALSEPFGDLSGIFFVYQSVMDILGNGLKTHFNNTIWCTPLPYSSSNYYYPSELEAKLIYSVKQSNTEQINSIIENISEKNDERVLLNTDMYRLNHNIKSTVFRIINNEKIDQSPEISSFIERLDENLPLSKFLKVMQELITYIIEEKKENGTDTNLGEVFIRFVTQEYTNPDFCRHTFAEKFRVTDDYVSKLFKEYTGFQFHDYITQLRIEHACRLLRETKYSMEKIAEEVGYNNVMSFRRAFKSYTGKTPKDYKTEYDK